MLMLILFFLYAGAVVVCLRKKSELQKCLLGMQGLAEPITGRRIYSILLTLHYCIYFYLFFNVLKMFQENSPKYGGNQTHWWDPRTWPPSYTSERQVHFSLPHRHSDGCIEVFLPHERSWERNV